MKKQFVAISFLAVGLSVSSLSLAQEQTPPKLPPQATEFYTPVPPKITPGAQNNLPPSDAIVLFDGSNLNGEEYSIATYPVKIEEGIVYIGFAD